VERFKAYVLKNFEQLFVLTVLVTVVIVYYFLPNKIAFLNFYYLPVLLAGYVLGRKSAALGSFLCFLIVLFYAVIHPDDFVIQESKTAIHLSIIIWGCFLILVGITFGTIYEKFREKYEETLILNTKLQEQHNELEKANMLLEDYNVNLEEKIKERTVELEESNRNIERLKAKIEEALYSTMDYDVVQLIIKDQLRNEKLRISVLFSDLIDFTTYTENHNPETVVEELNRFFAAMEPILLKYRGHIDKYIGDGIMCEFGAPLDYATHTLQSVLAAIKMQEKLAQLQFPWNMRIGICTGAAVTGMIGAKRRAYTAVGDVVNLAARLENRCPPGKVLIDDETYQSVAPFIVAERIRDVRDDHADDAPLQRSLQQGLKELRRRPNDIRTLFEVGTTYYRMRDVENALYYYEKVLALEPENVEAKVAYAEANLNRDKYEKVYIEGKSKRVSVYEVQHIKDPMLDRNKIPESFYVKYKGLEDVIDIPADIILPVEALDGSIGRAKVVAFVAYAIADVLGLHEQEKQDLIVGAYFSDIGKEIIPPNILTRAGRLNENEVREIEKHPAEGTRILRHLGYTSEAILDIVFYHHETYHGRGYPTGRSGETIPLGARIVAVVDTYDALTSLRPYRERWERRVALQEINRESDSGRFDPRVVQALLKLLDV
jgi:adenylate cyclase